MAKVLKQNFILDEPIKQEIFERGDALLCHMLEKHSQVFAARLDIHSSDENITKILHRLSEKEKRKGLDPSYLAVRELGESGHNHFHTIFFLNGNKTRSTWPLFVDANRVMNNVLGEKSDKKSGLIDLCNHEFKNGIMIRRNTYDKDAIEALSKKVSYLAKEDQKKTVKGKSYFSSQIKK